MLANYTWHLLIKVTWCNKSQDWQTGTSYFVCIVAVIYMTVNPIREPVNCSRHTENKLEILEKHWSWNNRPFSGRKWRHLILELCRNDVQSPEYISCSYSCQACGHAFRLLLLPLVCWFCWKIIGYKASYLGNEEAKFFCWFYCMQ